LKALKAWLDKVKQDRDEKLKQWVVEKVERNSINGYDAGADDQRGMLLTVEPKCGRCEDSCPWEGKFLDVDWCFKEAPSGYFFMRGVIECTCVTVTGRPRSQKGAQPRVITPKELGVSA